MDEEFELRMSEIMQAVSDYLADLGLGYDDYELRDTYTAGFYRACIVLSAGPDNRSFFSEFEDTKEDLIDQLVDMFPGDKFEITMRIPADDEAGYDAEEDTDVYADISMHSDFDQLDDDPTDDPELQYREEGLHIQDEDELVDGCFVSETDDDGSDSSISWGEIDYDDGYQPSAADIEALEKDMMR